MPAPVVAIFSIAVLVNTPKSCCNLRSTPKDANATLRHRFVAARGDGVLVLAIYAAGAAALRRPDWFVRPGVAGYAVMLLGGLAIGVTVEWRGLHLARKWAYAESMPRVLGLGIGAVPVVQMLVLPPICFHLAAKLV